MLNVKFVMLLGILSAVILFTQTALAWNGAGHKAVALIALRELSDSQKIAIFELLKNHPHWKIQTPDALDYFHNKLHLNGDNYFLAGKPSSGISDVDWAILQAATWPDFVRAPKFGHLSQPEIQNHEIFKFHRSAQHFNNEPFVLNDFTGAVPENRGKILETLEKVEKDLKDPTIPQADKAISFCWLFHLVGDIHQPLHSTMLVSKQFPHGDEGGNKILFGSSNLHSIWDESVGRSDLPFQNLSDLAETIKRAPHWEKTTLKELNSKKYTDWAKESYDLAKEIAYQNGKITGGSSDHHHDDGELVIPQLPPDYKKEIIPIAQKRVLLAGYRLAAKISEILP